jgi:hypothetical protein
VVIIDVSEPTGNLVWEVAETFSRVPAARIVLAVEDESHNLDQLSGQIYAILGRPDTPSISAVKRSFFVYPAKRARFGVGRIRQYWILSRQLRERLAGIARA